MLRLDRPIQLSITGYDFENTNGKERRNGENAGYGRIKTGQTITG
jgi:hypothetical protein